MTDPLSRSFESDPVEVNSYALSPSPPALTNRPIDRHSIEPTITKLQSLALNTEVPPHHVRDALEIEIDESQWNIESDDELNRLDAESPVYSPILLDRLIGPSHRPQSPTLHTRRLDRNHTTTSSASSSSLSLPLPTHVDISISSSADSLSDAISTPWSAISRNSYSSSISPEVESDGSHSPIPFFPIIPMLQHDDDGQRLDDTNLTPPPPSVPQPTTTSGSHSNISLTRSHLLSLASSSFGFLSSSSSVASSASSSCPGSPDPSNRSSTHSPYGQLDSGLILHTPDSPTWRIGSSLAHASSMELSARRRARESLKGRESVARLKMKGLSSRAQQAKYGTSGVGTDEDEVVSSDAETLSPVHTPFTRYRPTTLTHRVKPLLGSHGHIAFQATHHSPTSIHSLLIRTDSNAPTAASSLSSSTAPSLSVDPTLPRIDPTFLVNYLTPLSPTELHSIIDPIRSLLPQSDSTQLASPTSSLYSSLQSSSSSVLDFSSIPTFSDLHLTLLLDRCVARSHWRKTIPLDLLQSAFDYLDLESLLTKATRISKHWRGATKDLINTSIQWQTNISNRHTIMKQKRKLRVYRRLTREDTHMMQLLQQEQEQDHGQESQDHSQLQRNITSTSVDVGPSLPLSP